MTGAIKAVPIRGKGGVTIKDSWKDGPQVRSETDTNSRLHTHRFGLW